MAKSLDVAVDFLKKSIERGKKDQRYYMDIVKLHKLMYLGQCFISSEFDMDLFEEDVVADPSGPYINGLGEISATCGFGNICDINELMSLNIFIIPLSYTRENTVDFILDIYGKLSTDQIVMLSKKTYAYKQYENCNDCNLIISKNFMKISGDQLFKDICAKVEFINCKYPDYCMYRRTCPKIKKRIL